MTYKGAEQPRATILPDGRRLHLQHGPIDLIIGADGPRDEVTQAYRQATEYFDTVLETLAGELDILRRPCTQDAPRPISPIGRHMQERADTLAGAAFVTPMVAVAGAVADHVLAALCSHRSLVRAYVNNGGDIALRLGAGTHFDVGVCNDPVTGRIGQVVRINHGDGIGGIATSGWRGRSFSLGIADAVTVLAVDAASADVAATLIANAVDVPSSPSIHRRPAHELAPDSDLKDRLVTVDVGPLTEDDKGCALAGGERAAKSMLAAGQIEAVYIALGDQSIAFSRPQRARKFQALAIA